MYSCAICGSQTTGSPEWLLLVDNRWQDRLRVLEWEDRLARCSGVQAVCCVEHGRELIVHWMTTGSLEYPFAELMPVPKTQGVRRVLPFERIDDRREEVDCDRSRTIGELAIHRDSLRRILNENPQALGGVLETLLKAVETRVGDHASRRIPDGGYCVATTVM